MFLIAGTGSRSLVLDSDKMKVVQDHLVRLLKGAQKKFVAEGNEVGVICGMAEGFDECLAKATREAELPLYAYIPNHGYGNYYWGENSLLKRNRYSEYLELLRYAKEEDGAITYVCGPSVYHNGRHSNFVRNEVMVDKCSILWVYNPTTPGTRACYQYALKTGRRYYMLKV